MKTKLTPTSSVAILLLLLVSSSCDSPNRLQTISSDNMPSSQPANALRINIHIGSEGGDEVYCSMENRGHSPLIVSDLVSWTWDATNKDNDGKVLQYFSGHYDFKRPGLMSRYAILPNLSKKEIDRVGRAENQFFGFHFSLGDTDRSLAGFSSGKIKLTLILRASSTLAPEEYKADVFIELPLHVGSNFATEIPIR